MLEEMKIEPSVELAYFIGVMQGDGYFGRFPVKHRGKNYIDYMLELKAKDPEMVTKIQTLWYSIFGRKRKIHKDKEGKLRLIVRVKTLLKIFKELDIDFKDPPKPPSWVKHDIKFFGPYLAGLIDADGSITVKDSPRIVCEITIISKHPQFELKKSIENIFMCSVWMRKHESFSKKWKVFGRSFQLSFILSTKISYNFIKHVFPYIQIPRKKAKIIKYFEMKKDKGYKRHVILSVLKLLSKQTNKYATQIV